MRAAEFPNDNADLWTRPLSRTAPPAPPDEVLVDCVERLAAELEDFEPIEIVDELEPIDAPSPIPAPPPAPAMNDAFSSFVRMLCDVVVAAGGDGLLAGALLGAHRLDAASIPGATAALLVEGGVLEAGSAGASKAFVRTEVFTQTALAWASVLRGESEEISQCGPRTLDEWAADLVSRLVGAPARMEQVRRELRRRGVAAFGLLDAA